MAMNVKFKKGIMLSILAVAAIAIFDILSAHSGVFGTLDEYTLGNYLEGWWDVFYMFNVIMLLIIPITYYFLARRDVSESLALFLNSYILWFFGLADILYFVFQLKPIPAVYPWLNHHPVMGAIANLMGSEVVTSTVVFVSVILGFGVIYWVDNYLERI